MSYADLKVKIEKTDGYKNNPKHSSATKYKQTYAVFLRLQYL